SSGLSRLQRRASAFRLPNARGSSVVTNISDDIRRATWLAAARQASAIDSRLGLLGLPYVYLDHGHVAHECRAESVRQHGVVTRFTVGTRFMVVRRVQAIVPGTWRKRGAAS